MSKRQNDFYITWTLLFILIASLITLWLNRDVFYFPTRLEATVKAESSSLVQISYGPSKHRVQTAVPARFQADHRKHTISIENTFQKDPKSQSREVWVYQVLVDGKPIPWSKFDYRGIWVKRTDGRATEGYAMVSYEPGTPAIMKATGISGSKIDIVMLSHPWSGKASIQVDKSSRTVDLYSPVQKMYDCVSVVGKPLYTTYTFYLEPTKLVNIKFSGESPNSVMHVKDVGIASSSHYIHLIQKNGNLQYYEVSPRLNRSPFYSIFLLVGGVGVVSVLVCFAIIIRQVYFRIRRTTARTLESLPPILCAISLTLLFTVFIAFYASRLVQSPFMADDYSNMDIFRHMDVVIHRLFRIPEYSRGFLWILILVGLLQTHVWLAHSINVTLHLLNCGVMVYIFRKVTKSSVGKQMSPVLLLVLAVNPFAVESLVWVTGGYPIYVLFFSLIASISIMKFSESRRLVYFVFFVILSACAYFINEQGLLMVPFYIYITVLTRYGKFTSRTLCSSIKNISILVLFWMMPYVVYRVVLLLSFNTKSAFQDYTAHFGLKLVLSVYCEMLVWLSRTSIPMGMLSVLCLLVVLTIAGIRTITHKTDKINKPEWSRYEFALWAVLFILVLLIPFSLLGGWLEHRFFYISSCFLLLFLFVLCNQTVEDLIHINFLKKWQSNVPKVTAACAFLATNFIGIWSVTSYAKDVLQPISNLDFYVNDFIQAENSAYAKLKSGSVVFVDIEDPSYPVPKYFNASSSIRVAWVPPSLRDLNIVNSNVNVLLLNGVTSLNGFEGVTPYAQWFIPFSTLKQLSATDKYRFYLGVYDGVTLESPEYQRLKFTNINGAETMGFPLSALNLN